MVEKLVPKTRQNLEAIRKSDVQLITGRRARRLTKEERYSKLISPQAQAAG